MTTLKLVDRVSRHSTAVLLEVLAQKNQVVSGQYAAMFLDLRGRKTTDLLLFRLRPQSSSVWVSHQPISHPVGVQRGRLHHHSHLLHPHRCYSEPDSLRPPVQEVLVRLEVFLSLVLQALHRRAGLLKDSNLCLELALIDHW